MSISTPISVIIPVYNGAALLHETVASVRRQTLQPIEIVVVDDGSTEQLGDQVLTAFQVTLLRQQHSGVCTARNRGAAAARGEYLFFLDADDLLAASALEKLAAALLGDPGAAFAFSDMKLFGALSGRLRARPLRGLNVLLEYACSFISSGALLRRGAFEEVGGFDPRFDTLCLEDWDLWLTLLDRGYWGVHVPEALYCYRQKSETVESRNSRCSRASRHKHRAARRLLRAKHERISHPLVQCVRGLLAIRKMLRRSPLSPYMETITAAGDVGGRGE